MRILDLRASLKGKPFEFRTDRGSVVRDYAFTDEEPQMGGLAAVFRVQAAGEDFALKVLHRAELSNDRRVQHSASSDLQRRLRQGGGAVPLTAHVGSVAGAPALIMTWEQGESLHARFKMFDVRKRRPFAYVALLRQSIIAIVIAMQEIEQTVAELRGDQKSKRFVHGDLKPSNILIRKSKSKRTPYLATLLDFSESMLEANVDTTAYTPRYASPELVARANNRGVPIDWRSDQFAIGKILHQGIDAILSSQRISIYRPDLNQLRTIANRMTDYRPDQRFESWDAVLLELRRARTSWVLRSSSVVIAILILVAVAVLFGQSGAPSYHSISGTPIFRGSKDVPRQFWKEHSADSQAEDTSASQPETSLQR